MFYNPSLNPLSKKTIRASILFNNILDKKKMIKRQKILNIQKLAIVDYQEKRIGKIILKLIIKLTLSFVCLSILFLFLNGIYTQILG